MNQITLPNFYCFDCREKKSWILSRYSDYGFRAEIKSIKNDSGDRKFNKNHPWYVMEIIVTPYVLLNGNNPLGKLTTQSEIHNAYQRLNEIISDIARISSVNLWDEVILYRIDITKDIVTSSDILTHEIIKAAKHAICQYGYHIYNLEEHDGFNEEWSIDDSMMYFNKNQKIKAKIYNKKRDLLKSDCSKELELLGQKGLLRFELTLKRERIKADYMKDIRSVPAELPYILWNFTKDGAMLMDKYMAQAFFPGKMTSRNILRKILKNEYRGKKKRVERMLDYSKWVTEMNPQDHSLFGDRDSINRIKKHFQRLDLSPVCVSKECHSASSFAQLLSSV